MKLLYDSSYGTMNVVGLMSGSGSNLVQILELQKWSKENSGKSPFEMKVIFSDNSKSNANKIGKKYDIPVITRDIKGFYKIRNKPRSDMSVREEFDFETLKALKPYSISVAAYGGYMSIATSELINAFLGINVHPADLSILNEKGERKYTGDNSVRDAILQGEKYVSSTTHIIEPKVDGGKLLMISAPMKLEVAQSFDHTNIRDVVKTTDYNQERLKKAGDWIIFPKTIFDIAQGRYSEDDKGTLYYDGKAIPSGLKLD